MNWQGISDKKKQRIEKDIKKLAKVTKNKKRVNAGFKTKFFFNMMRMMQKNNMGSSTQEKEYWSKNGWLDKKRPWKA